MKHVVTGARARQTILVTGFGAFPGTRRNPSGGIVEALARHRPRLARLGIDLRCETLQVTYADEVRQATIARHDPDAILHLGLAGRRRHISIETRAINRGGPLRADAARRVPPQVLVLGAPAMLPATCRGAQIRAALQRQGFDARLSVDAGDYVCNAVLFHSLLDNAAPRVGFIHVPKVRGGVPRARRRTALAAADLVRATLLAVLVMARAARSDPPRPQRAPRGRDPELEGANRR